MIDKKIYPLCEKDGGHHFVNSEGYWHPCCVLNGKDAAYFKTSEFHTLTNSDFHHTDKFLLWKEHNLSNYEEAPLSCKRKCGRSLNEVQYNKSSDEVELFSEMMVRNKRTVHLELTNRCRISCIKCARTHLINKSGPLTHVDLDIKIIEKYAKSKEFEHFIICGNLGDPIYHPKFLKIIQLFKQNHKSVDIHTNGSGKSIKWWKQLFEILNQDDMLLFAIDGLEDTCGMYRVNFTKKDFYRAIEAMSIAVNEYNLKLLWLFIPFKFNEHQIEQARELAASHNIKFSLRKSARWIYDNDPLLPTNRDLISKSTILIKK